MKCNHSKEVPYCAFHYNGMCFREHNYECPALVMKNLSHGEMVQIAEGRRKPMTKHDAIKHLSHKIAYAKVKDENWADNVYVPALELAVREIRQDGEWKEVQRYRPTDKAAICECTRCHDTVWAYDDGRKWNYCPNCGADMREEKTDEYTPDKS